MNDRWFVAVTAGRWQQACILKAKEMGYKVIAIDSDPNAMGFKYADATIVCDLDDERALEKLSYFNIVGCLSYCSDAGMQLMGRINEYFHLKGARLETCINLTNKVAQRTIWRKNNLPSPNFIVLHSGSFNTSALEGLSYPVVLKPADSAGSRGVYIISSKSELNSDHIQNALNFSKSKTVIIEEFITGNEYTAEVVIIEGKLSVFTFTKKKKLPESNYTVAYELETVYFDKNLASKITSILQSSYLTLGYFSGIGHAEFIVDENENVTVIEVAGRGGGFLLFEEFVPVVTGCDATKLAIELAVCGRAHISDNRALHAILHFFPNRTGTVKKIQGFALLPVKNECQGSAFVNAGDRLTKANNDGARMGYIICQGTSIENARQTLSEYASKIIFEIVEDESY